MTKIYKINLDEKSYNKLLEQNWFAEPPILKKEIEVAGDSDAVKHFIAIINDPIWQEEYLSIPEIKKYFKINKVSFKKGKVIQNENLMKMAQKWQIEIDINGDGWIGITSKERFYPPTFFRKDLIDTYCKTEIEELKGMGILEEIEVDD